MNKETFAKILSNNDLGNTGSHQAGMLIPKRNTELIAFLPHLDPSVKNPDTWLNCIDQFGNSWKFRYIFYNNKLHDPNGTRNEYRITHMTKFFKQSGAVEGEEIFLSKDEMNVYSIYINQSDTQPKRDKNSNKIKLKGWRKIY